MSPARTWPALLAAALMQPGCGPGEAERQAQAQAKAQAQAQARREAEAQKQYQDYQQLLAAGRRDLALNLAEHLLKTYPESAPAARLQDEIAALRSEVEQARETRRLAELWVYHDDEDAEAGGRVRSAYIFARAPIGPAEAGATAPQARLVLRRHPQWGDDAYLLSERGPFSCGSPCRLDVRFDDGPARSVPGEIPPTGEPAIFVRDFAGFIRDLPEAQTLSIQARLKDGGAQTLLFEVGGYDPARIGP